MRRPRLVAPGEGVYHIVSRTAFRRFAFRPEERNAFLRLLVRVAAFSGVRVLTFAVLSNHFHLVVRVPERREVADDELESRVRALYGDERAERIFAKWERWLAAGAESAVGREKERLRARMHDLSQFCKTLKESFTMDYNRRTGNAGGIWGGRFRSVLLSPEAVLPVGAYVDANPVKAGMARRASDYRWSGFAEARRGSAFARDGIAELVRFARGTAAAPSFDEAAAVYAAALEGRIGSAAGTDPATPASAARTDPAARRAAVAGRSARGESATFAEMLLCEVACFERAGALGPERFVSSHSLRRHGRDRTAPVLLPFGLRLFSDHPLAEPLWETKRFFLDCCGCGG